ncbi:hypothetical protein TWF788_008257 [Orbilia oligospora]|uniref:Uncharacterized protein n=1 Tax=Orbilia oligospora TaxID=2813651 RepID=A0A7C8Q4D6_ORBOL|nr:hypothetical protein TWF788_008257 [Orbilia oligospora]
MAQQPNNHTECKDEPEPTVAVKTSPGITSNNTEWTPLQEVSFRVAYATYHFIWLTRFFNRLGACKIDNVISAARNIAIIQFTKHKDKKPYTEVTLADLLPTFDDSWFSKLCQSYKLGGREFRGDECTQRPWDTDINTTYSQRHYVDKDIISVFKNLLSFERANHFINGTSLRRSSDYPREYLLSLMGKFSIKEMEDTIPGFRRVGTFYATSVNMQPWVNHTAAFKFLVGITTSEPFTTLAKMDSPLLQVLHQILGPEALSHIFVRISSWYMTDDQKDQQQKVLAMLFNRTPYSDDVALQLETFFGCFTHRFFFSRVGDCKDPSTTVILAKLFEGVIQEAFKSHPETPQNAVRTADTKWVKGKGGRTSSDECSGCGLKGSNNVSLKRKADEEPLNRRSSRKRGKELVVKLEIPKDKLVLLGKYRPDCGQA